MGPRSAPALSLVDQALSSTHARCPRYPSSPYPHPSGNSSLPVPRSPSAPRPLLAWASRVPSSLVAALSALATPALPPRRALRSPCRSPEDGGHQTGIVNSPPSPATRRLRRRTLPRRVPAIAVAATRVIHFN